MSRQPNGMTTSEQRDQAADDHDEAAWQRDRADTARDREAAARAPPGSRHGSRPGRAVSCRAERW